MVASLIIFFCSFQPANISCQQDLSECIDKEIRLREDLSVTPYVQEWVYDAFRECTKKN